MKRKFLTKAAPQRKQPGSKPGWLTNYAKHVENVLLSLIEGRMMNCIAYIGDDTTTVCL